MRQRIAIQTDNWTINTKNSLLSIQGIRELEQIYELLRVLLPDLKKHRLHMIIEEGTESERSEDQ